MFKMAHLDNSKEDVSVDSSLMSLIQHNPAVTKQFVIQHGLSEQHTISLVQEPGAGVTHILEPDPVAHQTTHLTSHLSGHSLGQADSCHSSGLGDAHFLVSEQLGIPEKLGHLGGLARTSLSQ